MARSGAAGLLLRGEGQPLPHPGQEAEGLRGAARADDGAGPRIWATRSARSSTSCRRASGSTSIASQASSRCCRADLTHVFEFRDKSWLTSEMLALLERHGASFCAHDMPGLATRALGGRARSPMSASTAASGKYWGRYSDEALLDWTDWMVEQASAGRPVWAYFNNDAEAARHPRRADVEGDGGAGCDPLRTTVSSALTHREQEPVPFLRADGLHRGRREPGSAATASNSARVPRTRSIIAGRIQYRPFAHHIVDDDRRSRPRQPDRFFQIGDVRALSASMNTKSNGPSSAARLSIAGPTRISTRSPTPAASRLARATAA